MNSRDYRRKRLKNHRKGKLKMGKFRYKGIITPWMRACIGAALLLLAATPFVWAIRWW